VALRQQGYFFALQLTEPFALPQRSALKMSIAFLNYEPVLRGSEGDLVLVRIATEARQLEEVLEIVADLPFPVNPEIQHQGCGSTIGFPAYSNRVAEVRTAFQAKGVTATITQA